MDDEGEQPPPPPAPAPPPPPPEPVEGGDEAQEAAAGEDEGTGAGAPQPPAAAADPDGMVSDPTMPQLDDCGGGEGAGQHAASADADGAPRDPEEYCYDDIIAEAPGAARQQQGPGDPDAGSEIDLGGLSVGERLYYIGCGMERNRQERLREERDRRTLSELAQLSAKPMITARARRLPEKGQAFAEQAMQWSRRLEHHKRQQRALRASAEAQEVRCHSSVTARSQHIVSSLGPRYRGPVTGWNRHFARYQTKRNQEPEADGFSPNINLSASALQRDPRPVGDRLHEEAVAREERLRRRAEVASVRQMVDPVTSQPFFTPNRGASASRAASRSPGPSARSASPAAGARRAGPARDADVLVSALLSKGQQIAEKRERLAAEAQKAEHPFHPLLCARSKDMPTVARRPLYDPPRHAEAAGAGGGGAVEQPPRFVSAAAAARRAAAAAARTVGGRERQRSAVRSLSGGGASRRSVSASRSPAPPGNGRSAEFMQRNELLLKKRSANTERLRGELASRETADCTFAPRISARSETICSVGSIGAASPASSARRHAPPPPGGAAVRRSRSADTMTSADPARSRSPLPPPPPPYRGWAVSPDSGAALSPPRRFADPASCPGEAPSAPPPGIPPPQSLPAPKAPGEAEGPQLMRFEQEMMSVLDEWRRLEEL
eukprot:TRINITY_DN1732_c0_g2_i2.p1 TRINITY_DN1732_c0_g2~~TRINITY_DN1732_c0_g2_i2.p1  ORF type:complete len:665 (+),score=171.24 TRINITY_DN1732_c0_g2_i2:81-2075(+)